jgi:anti-sigma factor RsiW
MSDRGTIDELTLQAYIDGELPEKERAAIEDAMGRDPLLATQIAQYGADKSRLAEVYGRIRVEPLPPKWIELIESHPGKLRTSFSARDIAAIAAVLLMAIGGIFLYQRSEPRRESIIEEAIAARNEAIPARQTIAVAAAAHTSTADRVVASALAMRVRAPDLSRMGYTLSGVRIYDDMPGGKSVELLYRKANTPVFALYLRHPSGPARFDQFKQGRLRVCIWQDDVLGTVMTGEMSAAEMQRLASLAYTGLES